MSTIEDFKNAPTGATAYCDDVGLALKVEEPEQTWVIPDGRYLINVAMELWGFELVSASVALNLAWKLAHPVEVGQVIPEGTRYLESHGTELKIYTARVDFTSRSPELAAMIRTLERLPDPGPYWLDAPAVLAATSMCPDRKIWVPQSGGVWKCSCCRDELHWYELVEVDPLYSRGQEEAQS